MKQYIFFIFLLTQIAIFAQTDCPYYQTYMDKGYTELKKGSKANFNVAVDAFSVAMTHCPDKSAEARKGIDAAFAAINKLKIQADKNAKDAKDAAIKAKESEQKAKESAELAQKREGEAKESEQKAKESAELAQKREVEAKESEQKAEQAKNELNDKLEKIKRANEGLVQPLIELFDGFVNNIDYEKAKDILEKAVEIDRQLNYAGKETFTYAYLQLIYYHTECGRLRLATQLSKAMLLYRDEKNKFYTSGDTLQHLQTILKEYDKTEGMAKIRKLYYPTMIKVEGDTFLMENDDKIEYYVSLSNYEIAQTEVTVQQYLLFCEASGYQKPEPPSWGFRGDNPVVNVSWGDAAAYSNWLTKQENRNDSPVYTLEGNTEWDYDKSYNKVYNIKKTNKTSKGYRLPTEAEWQFAAAGGKNGISKGYEYSGSDSINDVAWYGSNSEGHSRAVKTKKPNALDLYDMSGNVFEWCQDWYNDYPRNAPAAAPLGDPCSDISGDYRVLRGGSWLIGTGYCRVVYRRNYYPRGRNYDYGFRPARTM